MIEGNQLTLTQNEWSTKMSASVTAYQMFAQIFHMNIVTLAHVNETPVEPTKPQALLDRFIRRLKPFEPARTAVVRRPLDNSGHCQLGSAASAALFPSRAMREQASALREAGRMVSDTTRRASHSLLL